MKNKIFRSSRVTPGYGVMLFLYFVSCIANAGDDAGHLARYKDGIPGDTTVEAAKELNIEVPIMVREWHIWWGAPYGSDFNLKKWQHWKGEQKFKVFNPERSIETPVAGQPWRRYLNSVGYPLLGPYDSNQEDIIRWQLETAKNTGIECLHLQVWPSLWDRGVDITPQPILDKAFDLAGELDFPIAIHDEIQFRSAKITKAQTLESSITRTSNFLKRYGKHRGYYRIDDMPVYYMQIWNDWMSVEDLQTYLSEVEKKCGPVYWILEGAVREGFLKIPEIKAFCGDHMGLFLHTEPYGAGPHPWEKLTDIMTKNIARIRAAGKKVGINVKSRFNHTNDRGHADRPMVMSGEDGMLLVKALEHAKSLKPDFIIVAQWNDFEEGGFVEPAWDFDGFNGDPYRNLRILAAAKNKTFTLASLPERTQLDRRIRSKLFDSIEVGDMGPVLEDVKITDNVVFYISNSQNRPIATVRVSQDGLLSWIPGEIEFKGEGLRLANYSSVGSKGALEKSEEMRFYVPGYKGKEMADVWVGIHAHLPEGTQLDVFYDGLGDNFRLDSRWHRSGTNTHDGIYQPLADKTAIYWMPLYDAKFTGGEGELNIRLLGKREKSYVMRVLLWHPDSGKGVSVANNTSFALPENCNSNKPLVVTAYDKVGNPGLPVLLFSGKE